MLDKEIIYYRSDCIKFRSSIGDMVVLKLTWPMVDFLETLSMSFSVLPTRTIDLVNLSTLVLLGTPTRPLTAYHLFE